MGLVLTAVVAGALAITQLGGHTAAAARPAAAHAASGTRATPPIARSLHGRPAVIPAPRRLVVPNTMGTTCFVGAAECSDNPCHELIGSPAVQAVATPALSGTAATVAPAQPRLASKCVRGAAPPQRVTARVGAATAVTAASAAVPVLQAKLAARPAHR